MSSINRDVDDFKIVITCPHCNHSAEMSSGRVERHHHEPRQDHRDPISEDIKRVWREVPNRHADKADDHPRTINGTYNEIWDELMKLPPRSVVVDKRGRAFQREGQKMCCGLENHGDQNPGENGPLTVVWIPGQR